MMIEKIEIYGQAYKKTVPQIMINGSYLGGFAELNAELTLTGD
jgi:glutaredoxin